MKKVTRELNDTSPGGVPFYEYLVDELYESGALPSRDANEFKRRQFGGGSPSEELFKRLATDAPDATLLELRLKLKKIGRNDILEDIKGVEKVFLKDLSRNVFSKITKRLDDSSRGINSGWEQIAEQYDYDHSQRRAFKSARSKPNEWSPTKAILIKVVQYKPDFLVKDLVGIVRKIERNDMAITLEEFIANFNSPYQANKHIAKISNLSMVESTTLNPQSHSKTQRNQKSKFLQNGRVSVGRRQLLAIVNGDESSGQNYKKEKAKANTSKRNNARSNDAFSNVPNQYYDEDDNANDDNGESDEEQEDSSDSGQEEEEADEENGDRSEQLQRAMLQDELGTELSQYKEEIRPSATRKKHQSGSVKQCKPIQAAEAPEEKARQVKFSSDWNDLYQNPICPARSVSD